MRFTFPGFSEEMPTFAANNLGARGALLSALIHFFQEGRWGSFVEAGVEGQSLTAEDQLFVLMQAGLYLTATRGLGAPEARICYERAEPWCHSLNRPVLLYRGTDGSVALLPHAREAHSNDTDCPTGLFAGAGAEQSCADGRSL
jgi:hypothetical protein